jgi:hypothetical protein
MDFLDRSRTSATLLAVVTMLLNTMVISIFLLHSMMMMKNGKLIQYRLNIEYRELIRSNFGFFLF